MAALSVRYLGPIMIPGPLQTEAYAQALSDRLVLQGLTRELMDEAVVNRLRRQATFPYAVASFVLDWYAPRRQVGSDAVMTGQLDQLRKLADAGVDIRVAPEGAAFWVEPMVLADLGDRGDLLHLERLSGEQNYTDPEIVRKYRKTFDAVYADSVDVRKALPRCCVTATSES